MSNKRIQKKKRKQQPTVQEAWEVIADHVRILDFGVLIVERGFYTEGVSLKLTKADETIIVESKIFNRKDVK